MGALGAVAIGGAVAAALLLPSGPRSRSNRETESQTARAAAHRPRGEAAAGRDLPRRPAIPLAPPHGSGHLAPGSDPSVLPGPILIADKGNSRLLVVDPHGRIRWRFPRQRARAMRQRFRVPDDAFFTPTGRQIVATEEDDSVISVIDPRSHRIAWRYGHPGHPGSAAGYVHNPDDAMMLPDGRLFTADIKNCRLLLIPHRGRRPSRIYGHTGSCWHRNPGYFGSPNGAFRCVTGAI